MSTLPHINKPLPQYQCHKVVGALKIKEIVMVGTRFAECSRVIFEDTTFEPVLFSNDWLANHKAVAGGYIVQYKDGYVSYSPADVFEDGYSKVNS